MEKYKSFIGKEVPYCYAMGRRLNFNSENITLCHSIETDDPDIEYTYDLETDLAEQYLISIENILKKCQSNQSKCNMCSKLYSHQYCEPKIEVITIQVSAKCNSRCIYCCSHTEDEGRNFSVVPYIKMLEKKNLLSCDCFFDYGGGEPTINRYFEETMNYLIEKKYVVRVNTNAIVYSDILEKAVKQYKDIHIRISVDAGTKDVHQRVKGVDTYEIVWNNIRKYRQHTEQIVVKYNLSIYNSSKKSIDGFINNCLESGIGTISIDIDLNAYGPIDVVGDSLYTEEVYMAAKYFEKTAKNRGLKVLIGYMWTARNKKFRDARDYNLVNKDKFGNRTLSSETEISLPEKYVSNIAKDFALRYIRHNNIQEFVQFLKGRDVYLYGASEGGKIAIKNLKRYDIQALGIADGDINKIGSMCEDLEIVSLHTIIDNNQNNDYVLVITSDFVQNIVRDLNRNEKYCKALLGKVHYMATADYQY